MRQPTSITTSWDDGHPLDLRIAELLTRYGIKGTFYVPRSSEYGTMSANQIRTLSADFELGGHTLGHIILPNTDDTTAWNEITGCKRWLEETTGHPCTMFCAPSGRFNRRHLLMIRQSGFTALRGVDLLSLAPPRYTAGLLYMPTTIQAYPHSFPAYARNALKRAALHNLWHAILFGRTRDWLVPARLLLEKMLQQGGVFHLWGHSWEIERTGQWRQLEDMLRMLSEFTHDAPARSNGEICQLRTAKNRTAVAGGVP